MALISTLFFLMFISAFVAIVIFVIKQIRKGLKMMKLIRELSVEANNENVDRLISFLESIKFLNNSPSTWDSMRAAFELVEASDHVGLDRKEKLRRVMMGLGVNRLKPIRSK